MIQAFQSHLQGMHQYGHIRLDTDCGVNQFITVIVLYLPPEQRKGRVWSCLTAPKPSSYVNETVMTWHHSLDSTEHCTLPGCSWAWGAKPIKQETWGTGGWTGRWQKKSGLISRPVKQHKGLHQLAVRTQPKKWTYSTPHCIRLGCTTGRSQVLSDDSCSSLMASLWQSAGFFSSSVSVTESQPESKIKYIESCCSTLLCWKCLSHTSILKNQTWRWWGRTCYSSQRNGQKRGSSWRKGN